VLGRRKDDGVSKDITALRTCGIVMSGNYGACTSTVMLLHLSC